MTWYERRDFVCYPYEAVTRIELDPVFVDAMKRYGTFICVVESDHRRWGFVTEKIRQKFRKDFCKWVPMSHRR